ncbi:hypothetical protein AYL99_07847 [Fonsecaea erecta]|uniref:Amidohydrolase-related domain-containing protein n=1 Tax=Fonsecaea erecta TaxID=1367422 RepID=A0A178ZG42_9EURO|nr:hypothetical protein AYL99_07847 [Fonsecaea erecta]OAP58757.1 hypothetical protein AYL99_07847 [Fonsecaea erecta]
MSTKIPLITLEEHFISQAVLDYYASQGVDTSLPDSMAHIMTALREVGPLRLKAMDGGRISLQVISHRPNTIPVPPEVCTKANNELYEAIKASPSPSRFAAFAMLPMLHPEEAAKELDRCVSQLGFVGSLIDNTANGRYYDDPFFWPIFAAHEKLDVPVYLHAIPQPITEATPAPSFHGNYSPQVSNFLANHGFHWHSDVALHVLRLPHGRDAAFPDYRIHKLIQRTWAQTSKPRRHLLQVWHENIYITTAGMFSLAPMACLIHMCCADKVLYSVDYPFCSHEDGLKFMYALRESAMINDQDFEAIAYKNAERLLDVKVPDDNEVGMEITGDEGQSEADRRSMPWLTSTTSAGSLNGDGTAFPHSPLETVREEK